MSRNREPRPDRPPKPRPDFPLFAHRNGRWAKKVRGKFEYFGKWEDDWKGERALQVWLDQKDLLLAGRQRRVIRDALTVADLANKVLNWKLSQYRTGERKFHTLDRWHTVCAMVVEVFGAKQAVEDLGPDNFTRLKRLRLAHMSISSQASYIIYIRALFKFAYNDEQRLISAPVLFGREFQVPKIPRKGPQKELFTAEQIRELISYTERTTCRSKVQATIRATILLGINCGFGNNDCGSLIFGNLDLEAGFHSHAAQRMVTAVAVRFGMRPLPLSGIRSRCARSRQIRRIRTWCFLPATGFRISGLRAAR